MVQLLLIKDANTSMKEVGHVIGIFEDTHKFSEDEHAQFNVMKIEGYTREELVDLLNAKKLLIENAYKLPVGNEWSLQRFEKTQVWKHTDTKWYFWNYQNKFQFTIMNMTQIQKDTLTSKTATKEDKETALAGIEDVVSLDTRNFTEVTELNK